MVYCGVASGARSQCTQRQLCNPLPIDPHTGAVFAYGFGRCPYAVVLQLQALLEPLGLTRFLPIIGVQRHGI